MKQMKPALFLLLATAVAFTFSSCTQSPQNKNIVNVNAEQATQILMKEDVVVIDIRTPQEYNQQHVEDALSINFYDSNFRDQLSQLDRTKTYMVYCHSGGRSSKAIKIMTELGFIKVYHLYNGARGGLPTRLRKAS